MTMKKLGSVTTISQTGSRSQTGNQHTATGVAISSAESSTALATLQHQTPSDTDHALRSSLKQLGLLLEPNIDKNYEVTGYLIESSNPAHLQQQIQMALMEVERSMVPMPVHDMEKALLTTMMLMTKPAHESPEDAAMRCKLYANEMQEWPADVFLRVIDIVMKRHKWWPSFAEFQQEYSWLCRNRIKLREALQKCRT